MISLIGNQAQPVQLSARRLNMAEILSYHSDKTPGDGISFRELNEKTNHKARAVYSSLCTGRCWARENSMESESLKYILPSVCDPCSESISLAASAPLLNSMSERWSSLVLAAVGLKCCFPASEPNTVPQLKDPPNTHTHTLSQTCTHGASTMDPERALIWRVLASVFECQFCVLFPRLDSSSCETVEGS